METVTYLTLSNLIKHEGVLCLLKITHSSGQGAHLCCCTAATLVPGAPPADATVLETRLCADEHCVISSINYTIITE